MGRGIAPCPDLSVVTRGTFSLHSRSMKIVPFDRAYTHTHACTHECTRARMHARTHNRFMALLDFVRDFPGEPVGLPER